MKFKLYQMANDDNWHLIPMGEVDTTMDASQWLEYFVNEEDTDLIFTPEDHRFEELDLEGIESLPALNGWTAWLSSPDQSLVLVEENS